jgi:hypothetical protein
MCEANRGLCFMYPQFSIRTRSKKRSLVFFNWRLRYEFNGRNNWNTTKEHVQASLVVNCCEK